MCGCSKKTSIPSIDTINDVGSGMNITSVDNSCDLSNVNVIIDIIEVAHESGVTPYLDKVKVILSNDPIKLDSIVLHIGGQANIDVIDYEKGSDGVLVFNNFDNQRNIEFNPMNDRMILSMISKGKTGDTSCVKNIYP